MNNHNANQRPFLRPMPWWMSVVMAAVSYCGLKYIVPALRLESPALQEFSKAAPTFAPLVAIAFLLLAAKKLYDKDRAGTGQQAADQDEEDNPDR
ncbi:MAG: hypothetical protein ACWGOX_13035 [Desulforhopalus sp.]